MSSDSDGEEEETMVLIELSGIIESDFLTKTTGKCRMLGVDTEKPLFELDNMVFQGEYQDMLGTSLLFEEKEPEENGDDFKSMTLPDTDNMPEKDLEHKYVLNKKLCLQRVFLSKKDQEKNSDNDDNRDISDASSLETDKEAMDTSQEANCEAPKRPKLNTSHK